MSAKNTYSSWWILTHSKLSTLCETLGEISNNRKELIQKNFIHTDVLLREVKAALSDYLFFKQLFEEELESVAYNTSEMQSLESTIENDLMVFSEIQKAIDKFNFNDYFKEISEKYEIEKLSEQRRKQLKPLQSASLIAFVRLTSASNKKLAEAETKNVINRFQNKTSHLEEALEKSDDLTSKLEKVLDKVGVTGQAKFFESSYKEYKYASRWSLGFTIATALLLCWFAYLSISENYEFLKTDNVYDAIQLGLAKVLIFSTLVYLLTQFVKDYNNNRHNAVLNKHRDSALRSYRSLIEATEDEAARDVILKEAASCIFSIQPTGYSAPSSDAASGGKINLDIVAKPIIDKVVKDASGS